MKSWVLFFLMLIFVSSLMSLFMACFFLFFLTILFCMNLFMLGESWLVYIIALTYIGGILILFIYLCSLNSKMKIELEKSYNFFMMLIMLMFMFYLLNFFIPLQMNLSNFSIFSIYSKFNIGLTILIIMYLTMGLYISMYLIDKMFGPLKQFY